jgi:hypothetical protein
MSPTRLAKTARLLSAAAFVGHNTTPKGIKYTEDEGRQAKIFWTRTDEFLFCIFIPIILLDIPLRFRFIIIFCYKILEEMEDPC